jgi:hypothetical protein
MRRFYWFLSGYLVFMVVAYIAVWVSTYSLARFTMTFSNAKKLDITICNPTNNEVVFYDGLRFGHNDPFLDSSLIKIEYRTSDGAVNTVKKADPTSLGGGHSVVEKNKIASHECRSKKADVKPYFLSLERNINKYKQRQGLEEIDIVAFRVEVTLFKYYSDKIKYGMRTYESDWFELPASPVDASRI